MDRSLYIAMNGAKQAMHRQGVNAHNLANVSTTGFVADLDYFKSQHVYGPGYPSRTYNDTQVPSADFSRGAMISTGNELDVAVAGEGWIAVQGADGNEAYTRAGDLRVSSAGLLTNGAGYPVMGNAGPIAIPPAEKIEIAEDGTISIRPVGQSANALAVLDRIKLVKPADNELEKGVNGLFHLRDGSAAAPDAFVSLKAGMLESSNVNAVDAMVNMINLARHYEMQVKMMHKVDENATALAEIIKMG